MWSRRQHSEHGELTLTTTELIDFNNDVLAESCKNGDMYNISLLIEEGFANNWNRGLTSACEGGHIDIVSLMIERGANNLTKGLEKACQGEYKDIAILLIENGANINRCELILLSSDIYYLLQKGISLGAYHNVYHTIIKDFEEYQTNLPIILNNTLTNDLVIEIQTF